MENEATITVNNVYCRLSGIKNIDFVDSLDNMLSYYVEGYKYTRAYTHGWFDKKEGKFRQWDGKKHLLTQRMIFPTGLLDRVTAFLEFNGIPFNIIDNRNSPKNESLQITAYKPRPYQIHAVETAVAKDHGIIRVGTGGGKTLIASMLLARYNIPSIIYVVGKDLLYQFYKDMKKCLGEEKVGIIGDGKCDVKQFNVCSVWTAAKAFELKSKVSLDDEDWSPEVLELNSSRKQKIKNAIQTANLAIFDEAHFLACDTIQSIFKAGTSCRYTFGLTGTDWRDDGADILMEAVCGPRIYNMPASNLIKQGYLVPPKIALLEVPRNPEIKKNMKWPQVYSKYITNNKIRNQMTIDSAKKLIQMGKKVLILIRYIKHGKNLVAMMGEIPVFFVNGELSGEEREDVKMRFENGEIKCLIASSVFDIGVDIPSLDALILAGGGKSTVRTLQRIGRAIRRGGKDKKDAIVVDFIDNAKYLNKHSAIRIAVYETEPSFQIKFPKGFNKNRIKRPVGVTSKIK